MDILAAHWRPKEISDTFNELHSAGFYIVQRPDDFSQPVVDVVFFYGSSGAIAPDTIERFLG